MRPALWQFTARAALATDAGPRHVRSDPGEGLPWFGTSVKCRHPMDGPTIISKPTFGVNLAVVIGNGFTLDCMQQLDVQGPDFSSPVDWPLETPSPPDLPLRDALPHFFGSYDALRKDRPDATQFELLRELTGRAGAKEEVEARHFITIAYRAMSNIACHFPLERWRWLQWLRYHSPCL